MSHSSFRYLARLKTQQENLLAKIRDLARTNPRFGYRRIAAILRRGGNQVNLKKVHRLWRLNGLQVRKKRGMRRKHGNRHRWMSAIKPNAIWAFDFVHDICANGQNMKCFAVIDEFTRESLAIDVGPSFRATDVVATLEKLCLIHGAPAFLRCDNGPEFISKSLRRWASRMGIKIAFVDPGSPWQNGAAESFNSKFRDELLDMEWFSNRREAQVLIEAWRRNYNEKRPHSALNYQTPHEIRKMHQGACSVEPIPIELAAA